MTDHANELRRHARKIGSPAGDTPSVMAAAAAHIDAQAAEIERLRACAQMSPATTAMGEISMRWREQGDGLWAVDLTTCNLTSVAMAHAAMAHLEQMFAGSEIEGKN